MKEIVYVVTRSEEHADYVERVFVDRVKAESYCGRLVGEDEYVREITEIEITR